jgi:hypothetical protein
MPVGLRGADLYVMRRAVALLCLTLVAATASGCSGADATEAQTLLTQSDTAFAQVRSTTFTARLTMTADSQEFGMTMRGGGYVNGKHAGDYYLVATADNLPFRDLAVTKQSGRISMTVDGLPVANAPAQADGGNPLKVADLSQYVKDVKVEHGRVIDGQSMVKITGVIDTAGLAKGLLGDVASGSGLDFSDALNDTRVVVYLSEATHLPERGLIDMSIELDGQTVEMHLDFAYTSYNERVEFP